VAVTAVGVPWRTGTTWRVRDKAFLWERPLRPKDLLELVDAAPTGPVVAAHVPDEGVKAALIAEEPEAYLTTQGLTELATEAWACRAPKRLAAEHGFGPPAHR
jgi:hypothetical protein